MEYDLKKALEWCAANEVYFKIVVEDGFLAIAGRRRNLSATYPIREPFDPAAVGQALCATLFSVERGSKFHAEFGDFPPVGGVPSEAKAENGDSSNRIQPEEDVTPPPLFTDPEQ